MMWEIFVGYIKEEFEANKKSLFAGVIFASMNFVISLVSQMNAILISTIFVFIAVFSIVSRYEEMLKQKKEIEE